MIKGAFTLSGNLDLYINIFSMIQPISNRSILNARLLVSTNDAISCSRRRRAHVCEFIYGRLLSKPIPTQLDLSGLGSTFRSPDAVSDLYGMFRLPTAEGTVSCFTNCVTQFDVNGNSGGCQATYTMITNSSTSTPSCQPSTPAPKALQVGLATSSGALQNFGIVDQVGDCMSIFIPLLTSLPSVPLSLYRQKAEVRLMM